LGEFSRFVAQSIVPPLAFFPSGVFLHDSFFLVSPLGQLVCPVEVWSLLLEFSFPFLLVLPRGVPLTSFRYQLLTSLLTVHLPSTAVSLSLLASLFSVKMVLLPYGFLLDTILWMCRPFSRRPAACARPSDLLLVPFLLFEAVSRMPSLPGPWPPNPVPRFPLPAPFSLRPFRPSFPSAEGSLLYVFYVRVFLGIRG